MSCMSVTEVHSGDGCDLASTLCNYDLFVLSWTRERRVRRGSISSELLMCGIGVSSILLYHGVAICPEMAHMFVFISVVVTVCDL